MDFATNSRHRFPAALLPSLIIFAVSLPMFLKVHVYVDDAYITFCYSRALMETGRFSVNGGEIVYGFTSPLWCLLHAPAYLTSAPRRPPSN